MISENLAEKNIEELIQLVLALWPECNYHEELENYRKILADENQAVYLSRINNSYSGFIHLSLRTDYVEGTTSSPVAYIEGIYVKPEYRKHGVARHLVKTGEQWGLKNGCSEMASDTELLNENSIRFHMSVGFNEVNRIVCFSKKLK